MTTKQDLTTAKRVIRRLPVKMRNEIVQESVEDAATQGMRSDAQHLGKSIRNMGEATALEVLAAIGWLLIEEDPQ